MATIKDVAIHSGFSTATVSAVINGKEVVSPRAKEAVLKAIEELNYRPNIVARNLKQSKSSSIAVLVRGVTNPLYLQVVLGLEETAWENQYEVLFCSIGPNLEREDKYINSLIDRRVGGVVIATSTRIRQKGLEKLKMHNIPYVFVNRKPDELQDNEWFIGADNLKASFLIVDHLVEMGAKKIAYLSGPQKFSTFKERLEGFRSAMESHKLPLDEELIFESDFTKEHGYQITKELVQTKSLPEVILCSSDLLASGAYLALKEHNIRVPEDILLSGFDNSDIAELMELTTIEAQAKEMGERAGKLLINYISGSLKDQKQEVRLNPELIVRKSSTREGADNRK